MVESKEIKTAFDTLANLAGGVIKDNGFVKLEISPVVEIVYNTHTPKTFYCVSVPGTAFLIKSNEKISVTGNCHSMAGAWLFKTLSSEAKYTKEQLEEIHQDILKTAFHIREHENRIIDMIFEKGHIKGITDTQLKAFIEHRLDVCLQQLGFKKHFNPSYNPIKGWFYKNINAPQLHDFFYKIGNQYNRNWNEQGFVWRIE